MSQNFLDVGVDGLVNEQSVVAVGVVGQRSRIEHASRVQLLLEVSLNIQSPLLAAANTESRGISLVFQTYLQM